VIYEMKHNLDDWWQTPLGDRGMHLYDLVFEVLQDLMNELKNEERLDTKTRGAFKHVMNVVNAEYTKLTSDTL